MCIFVFIQNHLSVAEVYFRRRFFRSCWSKKNHILGDYGAVGLFLILINALLWTLRHTSCTVYYPMRPWTTFASTMCGGRGGVGDAAYYRLDLQQLHARYSKPNGWEWNFQKLAWVSGQCKLKAVSFMKSNLDVKCIKYVSVQCTSQ